jgi:hypothetical protein
MLGAALATKQWAALAVLPVLIAAPAGTRVRLAVTCVALAGALTLPMLAGDPGRFRAAQEMVSSGSSYLHTVTASNVWWAFSTPSTDIGIDGFGQETTVTQFSLPNDVGRVLHHGVIVLALVLCFLYARRRRPGLGNPDDLLQLVALLLLARCMLDPLTFSYHHVPFLIALLSFEALRRQLPVLSAYSIAALLLMNEVIVPTGEPWLINAFYLAWTIPLAAAMTMSLFSGRLAIGGLAGTPAESRRPARTALIKPA